MCCSSTNTSESLFRNRPQHPMMCTYVRIDPTQPILRRCPHVCHVMQLARRSCHPPPGGYSLRHIPLETSSHTIISKQRLHHEAIEHRSSSHSACPTRSHETVHFLSSLSWVNHKSLLVLTNPLFCRLPGHQHIPSSSSSAPSGVPYAFMQTFFPHHEALLELPQLEVTRPLLIKFKSLLSSPNSNQHIPSSSCKDPCCDKLVSNRTSAHPCLRFRRT